MFSRYFFVILEVYVILVILKAWGKFWSFCRFEGYFGNFIGLRIFRLFFRFRVYFYHLIDFMGIFVILYVSGVFQSFFRFQGVFQSFFRFRRVFW